METTKYINKKIKTQEFKSYYVVWKPQVGCEVMSSQREFKSYYVVWKPEFVTSKYSNFTGLNRTMQYGNKNDDIYCHFPAYSLNRTMQYGN